MPQQSAGATTMTMIRPFQCYYASPELAHEVACPPYDAMSPRQRHEFAAANPRNYLNVMRSTEEFPEHERPEFDVNLQRNSARLQELIASGVFVFNDTPGFYLYRLEVDDHVQTGLIAELPVEEFETGSVKKHEHTRREKEEALIRYRDKVRASSTPISLTYSASEEIDRIVSRVQQREPLIDFTSDDGVRQTLWFIGEPKEIEALQEAFSDYDAVYLTDGHHRAAVCEKWAAKRREENPDHKGDEPYNFVLSALFPDRENRILEYNRVVHDLNGLSAAELIEALDEKFKVEKLDIDAPSEARPQARHQFGMYLDGQWHRLTAQDGLVDEDDPVHALDVCLLQDHVLEPLLGIEDPRQDPRIDYVPGCYGLDELARRVDEYSGVAFACHPTSVAELMAIADAGEVMPPKSTWFDPKVRSGLLVRLR